MSKWVHIVAVLEIPELIRNSKWADSETSSMSELKSAWRLCVWPYSAEMLVWPHQRG